MTTNDLAFPKPDVDAAVADVYRLLLGVTEVDDGSDFFDLGGHSMLAVFACAELSDQLKVNVPVRLIFDHRTVRAVSLAIHEVVRAERLQ